MLLAEARKPPGVFAIFLCPTTSPGCDRKDCRHNGTARQRERARAQPLRFHNRNKQGIQVLEVNFMESYYPPAGNPMAGFLAYGVGASFIMISLFANGGRAVRFATHAIIAWSAVALVILTYGTLDQLTGDPGLEAGFILFNRTRVTRTSSDVAVRTCMACCGVIRVLWSTCAISTTPTTERVILMYVHDAVGDYRPNSLETPAPAPTNSLHSLLVAPRFQSAPPNQSNLDRPHAYPSLSPQLSKRIPQCTTT